RSLKPLDFALGAGMATRRKQVDDTGGFMALAEFLADDYQRGRNIARGGKQIVLSPLTVECRSQPLGWRAAWKHQLRWTRTIRVCQPVPFFFSIVSNATLWPLLWLAVHPSSLALCILLLSLLLRVGTALQNQAK